MKPRNYTDFDWGGRRSPNNSATTDRPSQLSHRENIVVVAAIVTTLLAVLTFFGIRQYSDLVAPKINNLKVGKERGIYSPETSTFASNDTLHAVAKVTNIGEKYEIKARILFDDVAGQESGKIVPSSQQSVELSNNSTVMFSYSINDLTTGKYKIELILMDSSDQQKDRKITKFQVVGKTLTLDDIRAR